MKTALVTRHDCEDFVRGLTFLGTGGGGAPERGLTMLLEKLDAGAWPSSGEKRRLRIALRAASKCWDRVTLDSRWNISPSNKG